MSQPGGVCGINWPPLTLLSPPSHLHGEVTAGCILKPHCCLKGRQQRKEGERAWHRESWSRVPRSPEGRMWVLWDRLFSMGRVLEELGCCRCWQVLLGEWKCFWCFSWVNYWTPTLRAIITLQSEHSGSGAAESNAALFAETQWKRNCKWTTSSLAPWQAKTVQVDKGPSSLELLV